MIKASLCGKVSVPEAILTSVLKGKPSHFAKSGFGKVGTLMLIDNRFAHYSVALLTLGLDYIGSH